jgi:hypothetical protein
MGRKSHTTGGARAESREQVEAADQTNTGVWDQVRKHFPKPVRDRVDAIADTGGLSLMDIMLLEFAAHEQAGERIKRLERRPQTSTAVADLEKLRLQSRKHMRTVRIAISPIANPDGNKHPDAETEMRKRKAKEQIADAAVSRKKPDVGDELVN